MMKKYVILAFAFALVVAMLALTASATITVQYDIAQVESLDDGNTANGVYAITTTLTDTDGKFNALKTDITFDNEILIPTDTWDGTKYEQSDLSDATVAAYPIKLWSYTNRGTTYSVKTATAPAWTLDGKSSTLKIDTMYNDSYTVPVSGTVIITTYFSFADGKSVADFTSESFKIDYIEYYNGAGIGHCYNYTGTSTTGYTNDIVLVNNVVPAAAVITVPVVAGDIVYLQDGTFATAETTGDYTVLNDVGYVAVNTGKTAQKTYYVDGSTATAVHTNGVVGSDVLTLRDRTAVVQNGENLGDRNGLRFAMTHNNATRGTENHNVTEVGFVMTAESSKVIAAVGESYVLDMDMVSSGYAKTGVAYDKASGKNLAQNTETDGAWDLRGVFYNIPITESGVQTVIASRPYYKVGDDYIYGEITKATLYDIAKSIKADETAWDSCTESMQEYINEIIACVDGYTEIVVDEIVIDVSSLYE